VSAPDILPFATRTAGLSDRGLRDNNEDAFLVDDALGLYIVADGVGGHQAGEVASATTVKVVRREIEAWRASDSGASASAALAHAIEAACAEVYRMAATDARHAGMGSTCTALLVERSFSSGDTGLAAMGHVGDSRLYLLRDAELEQISTDHTLASELYRGGAIPRERVDGHPQSRVLTRSIGLQPSVLVESLQLELHPGDILLLSSDGLDPAMTRGAAIVDALERDGPLEPILADLVAWAKEDGSRDNITAVMLRCLGEPIPAARTLQALRGVPLLARLPSAELHRVAAAADAGLHAPGDVLIERGGLHGALLVVVDGQLRWELSPGQHAILSRGDGIGETTLVRERKSPGRLTAETKARVLRLSTAALRRLVRQRPRLGVALLEGLADELSGWIDPDSPHGTARPPHGLVVDF
jgi:serine/threonine protein phosphatase PrpC